MFFCSENVKNRENTAYLTLFGGLQKPSIWRFWGVCKKVPTTKITTTTTTGPSSNSYNNNNNNDDDDADDDQDDDNKANDDNDDKDDNKDNDNDNTNKNKNENEKEDQKQQQQRRQRRCSSQHVMSASSDDNPPLSFPPPTPTGIAGVRSSTIIQMFQTTNQFSIEAMQ